MPWLQILPSCMQQNHRHPDHCPAKIPARYSQCSITSSKDRLKDHHCPDKEPILTFSHDVCLCLCIQRVFPSIMFRTLWILEHPVRLVGNLRLRFAKTWGKEKATTAMAAKKPVASERENSITCHLSLPRQDTSQIVSMPQTSAHISKYHHCLKHGNFPQRSPFNNLNKKM